MYGTSETPSMLLSGATSASSRIVGAMSIVLTSWPVEVSGLIPGPRMISGRWVEGS